MQFGPLVIKPEARQEPLNVVGTSIRVLTDCSTTRDHEFTIQSGDEGTGPPPHSHDWDEYFFVLSGQIEFTCDGQSETCLPGTLVYSPAGTVHAFTYGPGGGEMLEIAGKGSSAAQLFSTLDKEIPPGPPDIPRVVEVMTQNGVKVHV